MGIVRRVGVFVALVVVGAGAMLSSAPRAVASCDKSIDSTTTFTRTRSMGCGSQAKITKVINGAIISTEGNAAYEGANSVASDSRGYLYGNYARWRDGTWGSWKTL